MNELQNDVGLQLDDAKLTRYKSQILEYAAQQLITTGQQIRQITSPHHFCPDCNYTLAWDVKEFVVQLYKLTPEALYDSGFEIPAEFVHVINWARREYKTSAQYRSVYDWLRRYEAWIADKSAPFLTERPLQSTQPVVPYSLPLYENHSPPLNYE